MTATRFKRSTRQWLRAKYVQYRISLTCIVLIVIAAFLFFLGLRATTSQSEQLLLEMAITGGLQTSEAMDLIQRITSLTWLQTVLYNLSATCVSLGVVLLIWELASKHAWLEYVRRQLTDVLTNPEFSFTSQTWREQALEKLLEQSHGAPLGGAILREIAASRQASGAMKHDFTYNIALAPLSEQFHAATFFLTFTMHKLDTAPVVAFARYPDSMRLHSKYEDIVESGPNVVYRYLLFSDINCDPATSFNVESASVAGEKSPIPIHLSSECVAAPPGLVYALALKPKKSDRRRFAKVLKGRCTFEITIKTIVCAWRPEFPIFLGYPVEVFRSRLDAAAIGASSVDVFEFLTSPSKYKRDRSANGTSAGGELKDVILPGSGLLYAWRTDGEATNGWQPAAPTDRSASSAPLEPHGAAVETELSFTRSVPVPAAVDATGAGGQVPELNPSFSITDSEAAEEDSDYERKADEIG